MVNNTIFQSELFTNFVLPFLFIFFILFAVLEKTKVLGDKKQLNALVAFVIGLIVIGFVFPKETIGNLVLFLAVALVVVFVALLLWGFVSGAEKVEIGNKSLKWVIGIAVIVSVIIAVLWAAGVENTAIDLLFNQSWSNGFWTNVLFIVVVAIALAIVLKKSKD